MSEAATLPVTDPGSETFEVAVIMPCLNEALTVGTCVRKALDTFRALGVRGEVVVVDNGSTDGSRELAAAAGARVVPEERRGYGSALMRGAEEARAPFIIMADADDSYDLTDLERFIVALRAGNDLVMGSRRRGQILPGAMPWHHRWIGNPLLSGLLNVLFRAGISDAHCGMRGFSKDAYRRMQLQTTGMEFASEMVIKAALAKMRIAEFPITLHPDGRDRPPHLRSFRDGWRHLRFMLLFSPTHLFLLPGALCMLVGLVPLLALGGGPKVLFGLHFDVHYMVLGSLLTILGFQVCVTGVFAKAYSHASRLFAPDRTLSLIGRYFNLERGLVIGVILFLLGFVIDASILVEWLERGMGQLDAVRPAIQASTLMIVGAQTVFSSFFLSMIALPRRDPDKAAGKVALLNGAPSVSVVIVNWNGGEGVLECIAALRAQTHPADEVIVVDNDSRDGSAERIAAEFPEVKMIRLPENIGFGGGVNRGAAAATGEWLALLNNDAMADREWLERLLEVARARPDAGMVACKIYLDRERRVLDKVGHRITVDGQNFGRGHRAIDRGQYDGLSEVAWPDGCAGLWRRRVFEQVGGVDEEFFAYADDADLGIRFRIAGYRCALAPRAVVEHRHSQSLGAYSPRKLFLVERNRIWLTAIYFPLHLVLLNPLLWLWRALRTVAAGQGGDGPWSQVAATNRLDVVRSILSAQLAGWLGAPHQRHKRARLLETCGPEWPARMRALLREAAVSIGEFARGEID